jgi:hypothetical protein
MRRVAITFAVLIIAGFAGKAAFAAGPQAYIGHGGYPHHGRHVQSHCYRPPHHGHRLGPGYSHRRPPHVYDYRHHGYRHHIPHYYRHGYHGRSGFGFSYHGRGIGFSFRF